MVMVTGNVADFTGDSMNGYRPVVRFIPGGTVMVGSTIHIPDIVEVHPDADGSFRVDLIPSDAMSPEKPYALEVEWYDSDNESKERRTFEGLELRVPAAGGSIGAFSNLPISPSTVYVGLGQAPDDWTGYFLDAETGDFYMVSGIGEYVLLTNLTGPVGPSPYDLAVRNGLFAGTETEWVLAQKGDKGDKGDQGDSTYAIAVRLGLFSGTEDEFVAWSKGAKGDKGNPGNASLAIKDDSTTTEYALSAAKIYEVLALYGRLAQAQEWVQKQTFRQPPEVPDNSFTIAKVQNLESRLGDLSAAITTTTTPWMVATAAEPTTRYYRVESTTLGSGEVVRALSVRSRGGVGYIEGHAWVAGATKPWQPVAVLPASLRPTASFACLYRKTPGGDPSTAYVGRDGTVSLVDALPSGATDIYISLTPFTIG